MTILPSYSEHFTERDSEKEARMPLLFVGHGNPMNAIEDNIFTRGFEAVAKKIPKPKAVLCISAHWETEGTFVTAMEHPETIHDFGGFPHALYEVEYPAPGNPGLALEIGRSVKKAEIGLTEDWGLDHGCWSVVKYLFPKADVPIVEMSIDSTRPAAYHYELARELSFLRREGVMIIGSGNCVHNLRMVDWNEMDHPGYAYDWAARVNGKIRKAILSGNHRSLIGYDRSDREFRLAVPTPEHFIPLLYVLSLQEKDERPEIFNDMAVGGSLSMMSVKIEKD